MKQPLNRIENDVESWLAKEQRFTKLFSAAVIKSRDFQKEKLDHFKNLSHKYRGDLSQDERISIRVLRQQTRQMERQLYPNLIVRLARRAFRASQRVVKNFAANRRQTANQRQLESRITAMGFTGMSSKLAEQIAEGKQQFGLPVSYYKNENERVDFELSFSRSADGTYRIADLKVSLDDQKAGQQRQHSFTGDHKDGLTAAQASNLLAGRAVKTQDKWIQLDLNDVNAQGKHRVKEFHQGYGYDLLKAVSQLPIKELKNQQQKQQLLEGLQSGEKQNVTIRINGKDRYLSIEANPQFKTINIYDQQNQKISVNQALERQPGIRNTQTQVIRLAKKNGISVS
ncbi:hypothetical protein DSL64_15930 [Dyadobacter luteus]|uniref:Uncharacterized protein n=1 Tax=Dyadobacter luteus TaxID=2259619 RepID=A0A3D8YCX9_9BACT|nr:hypothetical protein [Dyadobacter luteus]REA60161.1 hypothetical protein DSL64_15930 [Dyadobacter luteus]